MDKTICPNCGAAIYVNEPKCPFCGYINFEGAEEKFMQDMGRTEDDLRHIPELQKKNYNKSMKKSSKMIVITIVVVALIMLGLFGVYRVIDTLFSYNYWDEYDAKAETLWQREAYPLLDEMYEAGDYDGIIEYEESIYVINEKEGTHHSIYDWEHADLITAYRYYTYLQEYVEVLDRDGELSKYEAEGIVYYCMWFHYRDYDKEYSDLTDKDLEIAETYRSYADDILFNRLKFTEEEADALYEDSVEYGSISPKTCYKYADKVRERFK